VAHAATACIPDAFPIVKRQNEACFNGGYGTWRLFNQRFSAGGGALGVSGCPSQSSITGKT